MDATPPAFQAWVHEYDLSSPAPAKHALLAGPRLLGQADRGGNEEARPITLRWGRWRVPFSEFRIPGPPPAYPQASLHGISPVSPRYLPGISPVSPRCCSHVDAINMGATPGRYRGDTGHTPCRLAWGYAVGGPGILNSEKGTRHRPLAGNRPGLFIFTTVSLAQQAGAGQQRVFVGGGARKGRIHAPKLEKPAGKGPKKALTPEFTTG